MGSRGVAGSQAAGDGRRYWGGYPNAVFWGELRVWVPPAAPPSYWGAGVLGGAWMLDGWTDRWMTDGRMDGQMEGWVDGWKDEWVDDEGMDG